MRDVDTTVLSCLTPPGRGAIATVALRGPGAWVLTRELFRRTASTHAGTAPLPENPTLGKFQLGWIGGSSPGSAAEVVLFVRQATPVPWIELHCHGGAEVVCLLQEQFQKCTLKRGCQLHSVKTVPWEVFEFGATSLWRIAAQNMLAQAATTRTAAIALDQWHGAFVHAVSDCLARRQAGDFIGALNRLEALLARVEIGRHLICPWNVVVAGAPNVGKSSLVNALAGFARCLVAPSPGTTRDLVTTTVALDGWPVELVDTAGQRDTQEPIERAGVERAQDAAASAELCLWILDGSVAPVMPKTSAENMLFVINKTDRPAAWDWREMPSAVLVSATTAAGLPELCQAIVNRLAPNPPEPGAAVPHVDLAEIRKALYDGQDDDAFQRLEDFYQELTFVA